MHMDAKKYALSTYIYFLLRTFVGFLPLTIIFCIYYYKKRNSVPIMIGHIVVEVASVILVLVTSISPEIYQSWLTL